MTWRLLPARYRQPLLLGVLMLGTLALGWNIDRDLQRSADDTTRLYDRLSYGLDLMSDLQFHTQEVRRIILYALSTSDANRQLAYAEQSRDSDHQVRALIDTGARLSSGDSMPPSVERVDRAWRDYLLVRDEVIGLILERSLHEAVALDENAGTLRFNDVRDAIADVKASFKSEAEAELLDARMRGVRASQRLSLLVLMAVAVAALAGYLVNRRAALERAGAQLRRARDAAELATQAKSEFLATMSHELRTPLSGVIGAAELLRADQLPASQRDLVRTLRSSAHLLMDVVNEVLDYSRIEAGLLDLAPSRFAMRTCVEHALDPVRGAAERKGLRLHYAIDPDVPPYVAADAARIRQVLLNLLSNAVKFTEQGSVTVHVRATPPAGGRTSVSIDVRDSGRGIPQHLRHRLFQRFSRIDDAALEPGAGLGLAIAARLARLLGGALTVECEEGRGSTFTFSFPADVPEELAPEEAAAGMPPRDVLTGRFARESLEILLVEDNDANRRVIRMMLQELGFDADESTTGADAVSRAGDRPYDVIFMDVQMPDVDGLEATRRIRAAGRHPSPFIIALTAGAARDDEARCRAAGMNGYMSKPVRLESLASALEPLVTRASMSRT